MAYIIKFKTPGKKWMTNPNPYPTAAAAKPTRKYMESQRDSPTSDKRSTKTKVVKVDMRKSKSSIQWKPK